MNVLVVPFSKDLVAATASIWNEVVRQGWAFPQLEELTESTALEFFAAQS